MHPGTSGRRGMRAAPAPTRPMVAAVCTAALFLAGGALAAGPPPAHPQPKDPYKDIYKSYTPDFMAFMSQRGWRVSHKTLRLSSERYFYTLNLLDEDSRADALVAAALKKEQEGSYREALKMYQVVVDRYPRALYRVSRFGVFVPVSQYCQRRILNFPKEHLAHYRALYDPRAKESFEQARRKHSLIGLSEIVDGMLATSFGGKALLELGNASLDTGHYLAALERYTTIRDFFPRPELRTPELGLKVAFCQKMLGQPAPTNASADLRSALSPGQLKQLGRAVDAARPEALPFHSQRSSPPHLTADDYTLSPPSTDPLALRPPVWKQRLDGARRDFYVYSQPVVTESSIIYRHKNIVTCRSILTGELRWRNDLGGRATWQGHLRYTQEDVLVQDGLVFTAILKGGPSLVALDEVTGQLRWAYGPMVASTIEEARMRFETAPAGGPLTVYAGYVLDNIEGDTHIDTEYGLIAFESATGRIKWRTVICRLPPGKFAAGFAVRRRNRIRSWTSPPTYHQGTLYYCTNSGAAAAVDSLSGRIKWLFRYPYYHGVHDSTRGFGRGHHYKYLNRPPAPMFWHNKRPLVVGEQLYIAPVDTAFLFCIGRRDGRVRWTHHRASRGTGYFLGPNSKGELVLAYTGRKKYHVPDGNTSGPPIYLLDPKTGKTLWTSPDIIEPTGRPVIANLGVDSMFFSMGSQPFITSDDRLTVCNFLHIGWPVFGHVQHLRTIDLRKRKVLAFRRYYDGAILGFANGLLNDPAFRWYVPRELKELEDLPHKDGKVKSRIAWLKKVAADSVPVNEHPPFMSFSRVTFQRHGVPFELRFGARSVEMEFDRAAVRAALLKQKGPKAKFALAELALADSNLDEAARRLNTCLATISSEDLDFRALIKQQLFRVHKRLARTAIRSVQPEQELEHALGMSRTASVLAEEIETLFALADAYRRLGRPDDAARSLRSIISTYGHHEYPVAPIAVGDTGRIRKAAHAVMDRTAPYLRAPHYLTELTRALVLSRKGLPLYFSAVSPLPKPLTVRAGELAALHLIQLREQSPEFARSSEARAKSNLTGRPADEQLYRLWEFPGTDTARRILGDLCRTAAKHPGLHGRQELWRLADAARICRLEVPDAYLPQVAPPADPPHPTPLVLPPERRRHDLSDAEGINWLALERRGDRARLPHLAFLGGRVRKRLDNKFVFACYDLTTGKLAWKKENIRLKGTGQEPGFFEAFVRGDLVVIHGLYDVLAYHLKDGSPAWRFRGPFDFEIQHALMSGDLLILAGATETLALYIPTASANGDIAWQVKERGDVYIAPYLRGDRLVSVRKMPFNVTARYRSTGKLIGRLDLPDLSLFEKHPLVPDGPKALPAAHHGDLLILTDGWYYIALDITRLRIIWKRTIDNNDLTRPPAIRFTLADDTLLVLKEDYDQKALYKLAARTGELLWHTDPKNPRSPQPMHSCVIRDGRVYGLMLHPGQGFYFSAIDCQTGRHVFRQAVTGYPAMPAVALMPRLFGRYAVAEVQARQEFELKVLDTKTGKTVHTLSKKGVAPFGVHGRVSATVQAGRLVFLSKNDLGL